MKKIGVLLIINLAVPIILLIIFPGLLITNRKGPRLTEGNRLESLTNVRPISFQVLNPPDNINSVSWLLKNPLIKNRSRIEIKVFVDQKLAMAQTFNGQNVGDPGWLTAKFSPLKINKKESLIISISTDNREDNSLYIYTNEKNLPLFQTSYRQASLKTRLEYNLNQQVYYLRQISRIHLIIYLMILAGLNYSLVKNFWQKREAESRSRSKSVKV